MSKRINLNKDKINEQCKTCKEKCNQSEKVILVKCPNYKKKGK